MSQQLAQAGYRAVQLLAQTTIAGAVTGVVTTPVTGLLGMQVVTMQAVFLYGSGGTNVTAYVQTTFDGGVTWVDIASFQFTLAAATKLQSVRAATAVAADYTPTDGTLAANTIKDGLLGEQLRVKYTTTGTYAGATSLAIFAVTKGM